MNGVVLVVDDSLTVRMDLAEAFEKSGFRCSLCASLAEARAARAREHVLLVVLDVRLPDGDGIELLKELRENGGAHVPVLMLSTEAEVRDRVRGLQTGADEYVGKPYDVGQVVARARELLRGAGTCAEGAPTVLVIDDSLTYREKLREALEADGYIVLTASSGEEGLRVAAAARPSAILVDGVMPGIDGATVIRRLRMDAALRGIACVLLTASEDGGAELRALDAGADAFVRKEEELELILARLAAARRQANAVSPDTSSLLGPKRILAVDDSVTYREQVATLLRERGYEVVLACSGEEAIELLAVQPVDCILLDVLMPGLGGKETCRTIKASPVVRDIPVVLLTGLEDREAMLDGLGIGADDYISKSSDFDVLEARVRAQIRRKQFEDEHRRVRERMLRSELDAAEARAARQVADERAAYAEELGRKNRELETFSYSVSHDLQAPLRSIDGFSQALLEDYASVLDEQGLHYLSRLRAAAQRMGELIEDLLRLSRIGRGDLQRTHVDLSELTRAVAEELQRKEPERAVTVTIEPGLACRGDAQLVRVLLENLLGNAHKFTARTAAARIEVGTALRDGVRSYFVRDNGAGFDMAYASRLFAPFQRLHTEDDFPGTGIGLATVHRIVDRHGGRVWAEGAVGEGATIHFTLATGPAAAAQAPRFGPARP